MRTFVIGDIHGCYTALVAVVAAAGIKAEDRLVTLGDYVDRGPQVRQVLDWLCERLASGQLVPLLGNHELMMLAGRTNAEAYDFWFAYGGEETLQSYATEDVELSLQDFPDEHWKFIREDCQKWYEIDSHIFVHAGLHPDMPLDRQYDYVLFWDRFLRPPPHNSGKIMVCGHTPQPDGIPVNFGHAVCLDTGAYLEQGWLTCLEVETGQYWQANQAGETRQSELGEPVQ